MQTSVTFACATAESKHEHGVTMKFTVFDNIENEINKRVQLSHTTRYCLSLQLLPADTACTEVNHQSQGPSSKC